MSAARTSSLINSWDTIRYELLNTRVCDLVLTIEDSPLAAPVERLRREFAARALRFQPTFYLTDSWGCPDEVPVIGIPFYLADKRLRQIEEEQTGEVEDDQLLMMFLRHEAGHAVCCRLPVGFSVHPFAETGFAVALALALEAAQGFLYTDSLVFRVHLGITADCIVFI